VSDQYSLTAQTRQAIAVEVEPLVSDRDEKFLAFNADLIKQLCKKTRENIIAIGHHLTKCQGRLGHGAWLPWLEREFGWSDQTARNFMRVYEMSKSKNFLNLDLPVSSLYLLAAPSTAEEARTEVIERVSSGEALRHADVKEIIKQHSEGSEVDASAARPEDSPDYHCRLKDGRIDRKLERFMSTVHWVRTSGDVLAAIADIEFPPNLTCKSAAAACKVLKEGVAGLEEALAGLRKLGTRLTRLAAYKSGDAS
jgi:Protein of unknown function (DUF3102)